MRRTRWKRIGDFGQYDRARAGTLGSRRLRAAGDGRENRDLVSAGDDRRTARSVAVQDEARDVRNPGEPLAVPRRERVDDLADGSPLGIHDRRPALLPNG